MKRKVFLAGLILMFLFGCATMGANQEREQSLAESLVSTYERVGQALGVTGTVLMTLEATQTLQGNDLTVAKASYKSARTCYLQAGDELKKFVNGDANARLTYLGLMSKISISLTELSKTIGGKNG